MQNSLICIAGRPNVGKSTLFNRLVIKSEFRSITHNMPGVTRDYKIAEAQLFNLRFNLVDTAGLNQGAQPDAIMKQTEHALKESSLILFVVDVRSGITPADRALSIHLRKKNIPIILVINKCDDENKCNAALNEFCELSYADVCAISAEHNLGFNGLHELMLKYVAPLKDEEKKPVKKSLRISILGRPNAGKSTFINTLLGENRLIAGPKAGLTRDAVAVELEHKGRTIHITDTAGVRKKSKVKERIEQLAVNQVIETAKASHVVILLLDANNPFEKQDLSIASLLLHRMMKPTVIAINKIDSVKCDKAFKDEIKFVVQTKLAARSIPVVYVSALKKVGVYEVLDECLKLYDARGIKIPTSKLNKWLAHATQTHQPPLLRAGHRLKIKFISQTQIYPPTFQVFMSNTDALPASYVKYLENDLKMCFPYLKGPIRIKKIRIKNPFVE